jgi:L-threonylcarbamoyladenylate synthase
MCKIFQVAYVSSQNGASPLNDVFSNMLVKYAGWHNLGSAVNLRRCSEVRMSVQQQQAESVWQAQVDQAVRVLQGGGVVGYPSETVWGLAAWPDSWAAVERLYQLKGREQHKPVQLSCSTLAQAQRWLRPGQSEVQRLARFWPGPLTVLAEAAEHCPTWLAPGGVVGLRVPSHPLAQALLLAAGGTLATTSLNPSGMPAAVNQAQAQAYGLADFLLTQQLGQPHSNEQSEHTRMASTEMASTVFDLKARQVLRQGAVSEAQLLEALK